MRDVEMWEVEHHSLSAKLGVFLPRLLLCVDCVDGNGIKWSVDDSQLLI